MNQDELPEELRPDPLESAPLKIVKTLISRRPKEQGLLIGGGLILLCTLASVFSWREATLFNQLVSSKNLVWQSGDHYRLFSSLFLHADLGHLLSNSYMLFVLSLFVFGTLSISFIGSLALLALTLAGGVFVNVLTLNAYPPEVRLLGISGYVYLLAGFWFVSYLLIDRRRKILARLLRVIGVSLVILFPSTFEERISYLAHAHGFWIGVVMGAIYFYWFKTKIRSYEVMGH